MAARVCSTCDLAYPTSYGGLCRSCDGTLRYSLLREPDLDPFGKAAKMRAKMRAEARYEDALERHDQDAKMLANRLIRFVDAGLDYDTAVALASEKYPDRNEFVVTPADFEHLVAQGCAPHLAAEILR